MQSDTCGMYATLHFIYFDNFWTDKSIKTLTKDIPICIPAFKKSNFVIRKEILVNVSFSHAQ